MPLGSPIGSNMGLESREFLKIIIEQSEVPVVVDAGIGSPSQGGRGDGVGRGCRPRRHGLGGSENLQAWGSFGLAFARPTGVPRWVGKVSGVAQATSPLTAFLDQAES